MKKIALSYSGLYFRYYKAQINLDSISQIKVDLLNLAIANNKLLNCWIRGVSIILEKKPNKIVVSKLRAILLLEADFNVVNKIIFNTRLILQIEDRNKIPREIVGGCYSQSAIHIAVNKKLIADISN